MMIFFLLLSISATTYTAIALYAVEKNAGPLAGIVANNDKTLPTASVISTAYADEDRDKDKNEQENFSVNEADEEFWEGLHELFVNSALLLIALHIGGVLLSSYIDKVNLIIAMLTGRKEVPSKEILLIDKE